MSEETKVDETKAEDTKVDGTATPPLPSEKFQLNSDATIKWLNEDGSVAETAQCPRSTVALINWIGQQLKSNEALKTKKLKITVDPVDGAPPPKSPDGKDMIFAIAEGTPEEVLQLLIKNSVPPMAVVHEYQTLSAFMADRSNLKGVIITFVFGEAQAAGFGFVTTTLPVTAADIGVLGAAASSQAKQFKDAMKKRNPMQSFPDDDDNRIIIPGRGR